MLSGPIAAAPVANNPYSHAVAIAIVACAIIVVFAALIMLKSHQEKTRRQRNARQEVPRSLDASRLDQDCAELLHRARSAVKSILTSNSYARRLLPIARGQLEDTVSAIENAGYEITALRAELRSISAQSASQPYRLDAPYSSARGVDLGDVFGSFSSQQQAGEIEVSPTGPMTADAIKPGQRAIAIALRSLESRLVKLEGYTISVGKVDDTYRDWMGTQRVERLNPRFREIVAKTAADEVATKQFDELVEQAVQAERAFRQSVEDANLAGENLALPDD